MKFDQYTVAAIRAAAPFLDPDHLVDEGAVFVAGSARTHRLIGKTESGWRLLSPHTHKEFEVPALDVANPHDVRRLLAATGHLEDYSADDLPVHPDELAKRGEVGILADHAKALKVFRVAIVSLVKPVRRGQYLNSGLKVSTR